MYHTNIMLAVSHAVSYCTSFISFCKIRSLKISLMRVQEIYFAGSQVVGKSGLISENTF